MVHCCSDEPDYGFMTVLDSWFDTNMTAAAGHAQMPTRFLRSRFTHLGLGVSQSDHNVFYSRFEDNIHGVNGEELNVYYSVLTNHSSHAVYTRQTVRGCYISQNTLGVKDDGNSCPNIVDNTIRGNSDVGVVIYNGCMTLSNNNLYDNGNFDLSYETTDNDLAIGSNWWGTTDTALIDAQISDFYDDFDMGIVTYTPVLTEPVDLVPVVIPWELAP